MIHTARTGEAFWMPELVEGLNVSIAKRKRVVAASAGGLWNALVVDWTTIRVDEMCASDGFVAFRAA